MCLYLADFNCHVVKHPEECFQLPYVKPVLFQQLLELVQSFLLILV